MRVFRSCGRWVRIAPGRVLRLRHASFWCPMAAGDDYDVLRGKLALHCTFKSREVLTRTIAEYCTAAHREYRIIESRRQSSVHTERLRAVCRRCYLRCPGTRACEFDVVAQADSRTGDLVITRSCLDFGSADVCALAVTAPRVRRSRAGNYSNRSA